MQIKKIAKLSGTELPEKVEHEKYCNYCQREHYHDCNCGANEYNQARKEILSTDIPLGGLFRKVVDKEKLAMVILDWQAEIEKRLLLTTSLLQSDRLKLAQSIIDNLGSIMEDKNC